MLHIYCAHLCLILRIYCAYLNSGIYCAHFEFAHIFSIDLHVDIWMACVRTACAPMRVATTHPELSVLCFVFQCKFNGFIRYGFKGVISRQQARIHILGKRNPLPHTIALFNSNVLLHVSMNTILTLMQDHNMNDSEPSRMNIDDCSAS